MRFAGATGAAGLPIGATFLASSTNCWPNCFSLSHVGIPWMGLARGTPVVAATDDDRVAALAFGWNSFAKATDLCPGVEVAGVVGIGLPTGAEGFTTREAMTISCKTCYCAALA